MKHHFGDLLDREDGHWTVVPNAARHAYAVGNVPAGSKEIRIATIGKNEEHWERICSFPNLEELTDVIDEIEDHARQAEVPRVHGALGQRAGTDT